LRQVKALAGQKAHSDYTLYTVLPGEPANMAKKFPIKPANPERICWGCDKYCPADNLMCGNGTVATLHPSELFGDDWMEWALDAKRADTSVSTSRSESSQTAG
jgi:hypothetical protein